MLIKILKQRVEKRNPAIEIGKTSLGKYTCWINPEFWIKHDVQLFSVRAKELNIKIPIIIFSGKSVSVSPLKMMNTKKKIPVNANGSKRDQK